ncbi:hypothetical protein KUH03_33890 [Sphingobacterium sp. E70]|uniref:hypothetical protein n=1 Tax=Sphingobacterium sp. E70 TaxID=2853439 RepID=UPI00211CDAB6|nr:hypothetical protein [Sphingobacterium sp. E70]ULT24040.1 hypothetical protein KUH03_33890 [Sphingobacterium sp. E70]
MGLRLFRPTIRHYRFQSPYITPNEKQYMQQNVLAYEPELALFIEESAPLIFYDVISSFALKHLVPHGDLYFEINQYLGPETKELIEKKVFIMFSLSRISMVQTGYFMQKREASKNNLFIY